VYVYILRTDTLQDDVHTPASHTLTSAQHLEDVVARVELLEQELERIPPQLEAPKTRESPLRRSRRHRRGRSPGPLREVLRRPYSGPGGVG
jgi:hypothetical protein